MATPAMPSDLEILDSAANDFESLETIRNALVRNGGSAGPNDELLSSLLRLNRAGLLDMYFFNAAGGTFDPVLEQAAMPSNDLWFRASAAGRAKLKDEVRSLRRRKGRTFYRSIFAVLVLAAPLPVTDFLVSGGIVPPGYILVHLVTGAATTAARGHLWSGVTGALLLSALYWMVWIEIGLLYGLSRLLNAVTPKSFQRFVFALVIIGFGILATRPIYCPMSHRREEPIDLAGVYRRL